MNIRDHRISGQPDIESALWLAAHWIWDRRNTAKRAGFPFSEETITESVLLDIASACPNQIKIVPFNKHQEGKIGADWEWCFYDRTHNRFLRFLMQAKVLDDADRQYGHIDRLIGNSDVRQIDRLRETATERGVAALYAFYNHLSDTTRLPINACRCAGCHQCWGASVAPLDAVLHALPDKTFDTLRQVSIPWLCLLCPVRGAPGAQDVISTLLGGLQTLYERARDGMGEAMRDVRFPPLEPDRDAPAYLGEILELPAEGMPTERQARIRQLAARNPGVDGIVLVDANPEHRGDRY